MCRGNTLSLCTTREGQRGLEHCALHTLDGWTRVRGTRGLFNETGAAHSTDINMPYHTQEGQLKHRTPQVEIRYGLSILEVVSIAVQYRVVIHTHA